jgi:flagellar basal body rod protein FlgC
LEKYDIIYAVPEDAHMRIDSAFNTAEFAMRANMKAMDKIAANVAASSTSPNTDVVQEMAGMVQTQNNFEANAKVLKSSDEMLNMLLGNL